MPDQDATPDSDDPSILDAGSSAGSPDRADAQDEDASASPPDEPTGSVDELHYDDEDLGEKLRHADDGQLDKAPFGIIQVDDEGTVEFFNQYEAELSGMDPDDVVGRNFFTQVAPCTNNRLFRGRFKKGVRRGELDETFTYTYTYKMRPTLVDVHLYRDSAGNNWITVQKY
jgi:photoactive yellow protein